MKSYARFKRFNRSSPIEHLLALVLRLSVCECAVGLGGMIHRATKQGEGGRSQPADYGQVAPTPPEECSTWKIKTGRFQRT